MKEPSTSQTYGPSVMGVIFFLFFFLKFKIVACYKGNTHRHAHKEKANYTITEQSSTALAAMVITDQSNYTIRRFS